MGFVGISSVVHAAEDLLKTMPPGQAGGPIEALLGACDAILAAARRAAGRGRGGAGRRRAAPGPHRRQRPPPPRPRPPRQRLRRPRPRLPRPRRGAAPAASVPPPPAPPAPPAQPLRRADDPKAELRGDRPVASIRVDVDRLDEIAALAGDVLVEGARSIRRSKDLNGLFARWARLSDRIIALAERIRDSRNQRLVEQIDGDVHLLRSDTFRFARQQTEAAATAHAQFGQLAERIGAARLIPLSGVLAGFPRAARDMAREQGKEVECLVQGRRDRGGQGHPPLAQRPAGPPGAQLRRPRHRGARGAPGGRASPAPARSIITARTDGDLLAVTVEDDGRGIDPAAVRAAALRKGLIADQQAAGLSSRAALDLIFLPGFTTREHAGETSGRGVGLDVVRKKVTALGGSVAVESEPGKGTRASRCACRSRSR